jgi:hypothetical protein
LIIYWLLVVVVVDLRQHQTLVVEVVEVLVVFDMELIP